MSKIEIIANEKYYYHKTDNDNKKGTIVFVHGFSSSYKIHEEFLALNNWDDYDYFALNFSDHQLANINQFKHQSSTNKNASINISIENYVNELVEVIIKFDLHNIVFIGHSMGGGISLLTYSKIASRVVKIILISAINPAIYSSKVGLKYLFGLSKRSYKDIKEIEIDSKYLSQNIFRNKFENYLNYEINRLFYQKRKYLILGSKLLAIDLYVKLNSIYKNINIPLLFLIGEKDKVIPAKQTIHYLEHLKNPNIEYVVIKNTRHLLFIEKFDEYNQNVWNFINKK